ncbi:hypothetical protein ACQJBY_036944 [Aegilops geniculata]
MWQTRAKKAAAAAGDAGSTGKEGDKAPVKGGSDAPANGVVVSVPVHCDGCARKVRRSLLRLDGVEDVIVDHSTNTVVVTGQKALENPIMVVEAVKRKTGKKAVLLSPSPEKLPPPVKSEDTKKHGAGAPDMKKDVAEFDMEMVVVLKIELHCEDCSEEMKKRILKIKGVEEAVPHIKSSQLMVKGMVEPATLVSFIHKCTGRKAAIIRAEPLHEDTPAAAMAEETPAADANAEKQEPSDNLENKNGGAEEETKQEVNKAGGEEGAETEKPSKGDGDGVEKETVVEENQTKEHLFKLPVPASLVAVAPEAEKMMAMNGLYQYNYHPAAYPYAYPHYAYQQYHQYPYAGNPATYYGPCPQQQHYPPQTFGDQSPDACTIM